MKNKILLFLISILLTITISIHEVYPSSNPLSQDATHSASNLFPNNQQSLSNPLNKYIDPELFNTSKPTRIILLTTNSVDPASITGKLLTSRITPSIGGLRILLGVADARAIQYLANNPEIVAILRDRRIEYSTSTNVRTSDPSPRENMLLLPLEKARPVLVDDATVGKPGTTLREAVDIIGAQTVWTDFGINGANLTIAIVDTGVDYGTLNLGYWNIVARDKAGYPSTFDPDAEGMVLTNTIVNATYLVDTKMYLNTSGIDPDVYFALGPWLNTSVVTKFSNLTGYPWPADMEITGIISRSGDYHFGVVCQWWNMVSDWLIMQIFPVLAVDSAEAGVYDTVYVDISYDWAWMGLFSLNYPDILPFWPGTWPPEFSFADETPIDNSHPVAAMDFTGDGVYDLSAGSLGYLLDVWGVSPNVGDRGLVLKPIDPGGNYVIFVNDWFGHGTFCANTAAGRNFEHPLVGSGAAPGAKIMGITALYIGDLIEAELWAAGFDLITGTEGWQYVSGYGTVYGSWQYTGNHKADIISNSWGISEWAPPLQQQLLPWYDVLTMLEDALTVPGYLDPQYPGTTVVHAWGNGGSGYGTITEPCFAALPISVGASTSLNTTSKTRFSLAGGSHDDVISWSARGPTPMGNAKPDVVNIGAFGWTAGPVWLGLGNGSASFDLFGGTSMAAPLTAGVAALTMQAYQRAQKTNPLPENVKILLKSSAKDLGYDPFVQGAGRVDALAAVELASNTSGIQVSSPATWENIQKRIIYSWSFYQSLQTSQQIPFTSPQGPMYDTGWFAGTVSPGKSTTTQFTIRNPTNRTVNVTIEPVKHQLIITQAYANQTEELPATWQATGLTWGYLLTLNKTLIPKETELLTASVTIPYEYFDPDGDYNWNQRCGIFILDWTDLNADLRIDPNETYNLNYGYNYGTSSEARVGFPYSRIQGQPVILIYQRNQTEDLHQIPFNVSIAYYSRDKWTWVETPDEISVEGKSSVTFNASIIVPEDTSQGVYEGQIEVSVKQPYNTTIMIPVSLQVSATLSGERLTYDFPPSPQIELYDSYRVNGHFDWNWRYESGDWKQWIFNIQDREVVKTFVTCSWTETETDVDMFTINPLGFLTDASFSPYLESGRFQWKTRTGTTEDYVVLDTNWMFNPVLGTYTVLLHNVLFGGKSFPEEVSGKVQLVKLSPRGPISLKARQGQTVSQNFTITTGRELTDLAMSGLSVFQVHVTPTLLPQLGAEESGMFEANIEVPQETPEGKYTVILAFVAREFPDSPAYTIINLSVDNSPPTLSMISPQDKSIVTGSITIEAYAEDPSGIQDVNFTAGATSAEMTFNSTTSHYAANLSTTELPDGQNTVEVKATDKAGNTANSRITLTVDNTSPVALINAPLNNTYHTRTVTIEATGLDENLERMQLYANESMLIEWSNGGIHTYAWNTTNYSDGIYTVLPKVYDKAGHMSQSQIAITIDNTKPMVSISIPENYTIVKGTIKVSFSAWDEHLLNVSLSIDGGTPINVTGSAFIELDTRNLTDGLHVLRLSAKDLLVNEAETSTSIIVDNTLPTATIISPQNGSYEAGRINIDFAYYDENLQGVVLTMDSDSRSVTGTTEFPLDTTILSEGAHTITLTVTDKAGNTGQKTVTTTIDNTPPSVHITKPANQAELSGNVTIQFSAQDQNPKKILLYIDQAPLDVTGRASYQWDTTQVGDGGHTIRLIATDQAGNNAEEQITVTTTNVEMATEKSQQVGYQSGIGLGLMIGAVSGIVVGSATVYIFTRKTKREQP